MKVLTARLDGQDGKALLALVDQLKNKLGRAVILLGSAGGVAASLQPQQRRDDVRSHS